jgi:TonB-linked SusC/RagA family outer membrane protein
MNFNAHCIELWRLNGATLKKLLLVMKLTTLLMTVALLSASAAGYSQITLKEKNAPLEKVLNDIKKQTKYVFLYDPDELNTGPVTVEVSNVTLDEALRQVFKNLSVEYTVEDNNVLIKLRQVPLVDKTKPADITTIDVHGRVVGENLQPISGATVQSRDGKQLVTVTDDKGNFTLKGVNKDAIISITFIGYEKKELPATGEMGDIKLNIASSQLDAVQIIAYGTTTQRLNTSDVSSVSAKKIEEQPVNSPLLALEGQVAGAYVTQSSGLPGSGVQVQIRGFNSIRDGSAPLYIIDGVPYSDRTVQSAAIGNPLGYGAGVDDNPFTFLNPADIESIDILKDAAATAIYGSRGANGVILITTKKGKAGAMKIDLNMRDGFGEVAHEMPLLNTSQYLEMRHEAFKNDGSVPNPNADYDLTLWDTTRNTDWQKVLIGGKAQYADVNLTISGGNANTQYLIGSGYHRETGVTPGGYYDQRGSLNFNINSSSPNQKFRITLSGNYSVEDNNLNGGYNFTAAALSLPPDTPPLYKPDGTINWAPNAAGYTTWSNQYSNPIASLLSQYNVTTDNVLVNSTLSYEIISGLLFKCDMGYSYNQVNQFGDEPFAAIDPATWSANYRYSRFGNANTQSWIVEPQVTFKRAISKGVLNVLAGMTINQISTTDQVLLAQGFSSDLLLRDIAAATTVTGYDNINSIYKYNAIFGRADYNWQDKYLLNLTIRRDGSSRFGPANRFHDFWDIGAAWIFSEEKWIKNNLSWLSLGKLRGSYGTTGNDQIGDYSYLDLYQSTTAQIPYQGASGLVPTQLYTPNLQWELTRKMEGGIELGFLKDRILLDLSYYRNRSSNELLPYQLPSITGFIAITKNLDALVQNKGWEWELSAVNVKTNKFRWSTSINFSLNSNLLLSAGNSVGALYQKFVGHPLNGAFVYHFLGVNPITGLAEFASSQGGETTTPNSATDMNTYITAQPQFYGGFQNSFSYKVFQLDLLFQFVKQQRIVNLFNGIPGTYSVNNVLNQPTEVLARWQQPGDVTNIERFSENGSLLNSYVDELNSDLSYGDASFVRLKNVSLSVTLPEAFIKKTGLHQARIFIQGQNLLTFTKYKGLDPETPFSQGAQAGLPPLRIFTGGIQATF